LCVAALTGLAYAELGGRFPRSAGESFFSQQAFRRPAVALLVGWVVLWSCILSLSTVSVAFAGYLRGMLPGLPSAVAILAIVSILAFINFRGIRESSAVNILATMVELSGLLIVIFAGALFLYREPTAGIAQSLETGRDVGWTDIARGGALAFFAFIGFEDMVNVAEEVKEPERNLPRAIVAAFLFTGVIYLIVVIVATSVVEPATLAESEAALLTVVQHSRGAVSGRAFTLIALFAVANTGLLNFITASRLLYGMSRQGLLPQWLGVIHARRMTPHWAILIVLAVALALAISGSLSYLAGTTSLLLLSVFFVVNLSLVIIKRRDTAPWSGFRVPIVIPILGATSCLLLMPFVPRASLATTVLILAAGLPLALRRPKAVP
jgi:APA family basic amino acid/polyamine antiporter